MKNIKKLLLLLPCILLLNGCVKYNTTMTINSDKSMEINIDLLAAKSEDTTTENTTIDEEELNEYKENGFNLTKKTVDGYEGYNLSKKVNNIDEISGENVSTVNFEEFIKNKDTKLFKVEKGFLKNTYTANIEFTYSTTEEEEDAEVVTDETEDTNNVQPTAAGDEPVTTTLETPSTTTIDENTVEETEEPEIIVPNEEPELTTPNEELDVTTEMDDTELTAGLEEAADLMNEFEWTYVVKLPTKAISQNATKVENNTLTWVILDKDNMASLMTATGALKTATYSFSMYNVNNIMILGGGALLLVVIIIVIIAISKKKKEKAVEIAETSEPIHTDFDPSIANQIDQTNTQETTPVVEPAPIVEATPVVEPVPIVEATPVVEPTPVVEATPVVEPTPVVEATPVVEPTPVVESTPVVEQTPVVETAPETNFEPQTMENHEFNIPAETAITDAPAVEPAPVFVDNAPVVEETPVVEVPSNEIQIEEPPIVNVEENSGN